MESFGAGVWTVFWKDGIRIAICFLLLTMCSLGAVAQSSAQFVIPATGCLGENIIIQNQTVQALRYEWDFCEGDLSNTPTASNLLTLGGSVTTGIDVVFDGTNWFGFVASEYTNSILRLDFGPDINATPSISNLGNIGGILNLPSDIKIVSENGKWYGFVYGSNAPVMSRINFGNSLTNTTTGAAPITIDQILAGPGTANGGFDMINDGTNWQIVLTQNTTLTIIRMPAINALPAASDILTGVSNSFSSGMGDIVLQKSNGNYFGYVVSYGNKSLQAISFGSTIFTGSPTINNITAVMPPSGSTPFGIDAGYDNGEYNLFISTLEGNLLRINLGADLTAAPVSGTSLGKLGVLNNGIKLKLISYQSNWVAFSPDYNTTSLYAVRFPNACGTTPAFSTQTNPTISYSLSGQKFVGLRAYSSVSDYNETVKPITISGSPAPDIDFTFQVGCSASNTTFTSSNLSGNLNSYSWDFGDGSNDATMSPVHVYASGGAFNVDLKVGATNGCSNRIRKTLSIFNHPVADFTLPAADTVCTNQNYNFTNQTTFDPGSNPSWQWFINGTSVATTQNLAQSFTAVATQQIKLVASITGCSSQKQQDFTITQQGPVVDFTGSNGCQGSPLQFNNTTVGTGLSYTWTFGDGNSSTQLNPKNTYSSFGLFSVSLVASSVNGCQNSNSKPVTIYSAPQPDFSLALPPFSCSGSPSQFSDATPSPTDSNLSSWVWHFGNAANDSSLLRNPSFTYLLAGPYTVSMKVTSNFGCSATVQKVITISQSPIADFTNTPACVNQGTVFKDTSSGSIKSWLWNIGINNYSSGSFSHVFSAPGSFDVKLIVTDNNGCIGQTTKSVSVPIAQSPDFSSTSTCATTPTIFKDITPTSIDPFISYSWDFAGQGTGSGSPVQFVFPETGSVSVKMDAQAKSGCIYGVTKTIAIVSPPNASFTTSTDAGAAPLFVKFTNTSVNATGYLWHFHDHGDSTNTAVSPSFTFNNLGDYIVDLDATNDQGCSNTFTKVLHAVLPNVDAAITDLQFIRDPASGQLKALFVIDNLGNLPLANPTIVVEISGNTILSQILNLVVLPGQTASQILNYSFVAPGLQYVCISVEAGQDVNLTNDKECANTNSEEPFVFSPYPNPVNGELHIDWIASGETSVEITIYNTAGEQAFEQKLESVQSGLNQIRIDVSSLAKGLYITSFRCADLERRFRFIVN